MAEMGKSSLGSDWYFSRKEIEENSPSRRDGIDLKKETCLRKSYCTFLQDLGMRLKVPQITIATAIVFCHRFFIRQSHAKNDRRTIATVCMFLAAKVEESPQPLQNVILVSYGMIHKNDPSAAQRIKQKEVYEQQKDLILLGERLVLATLGFELNVQHPYIPLVMSIKKFNVARNDFVQAAWNFVNDGLRTLLCLQYKPQHIAAGAILLSARFLNVKLPSDAEKPWWHEFDVTARQLEDISNQMMALYHRKRMAGSGVEGSNAGGSNHPKMVASNVGGNAITLHTRSPGVGNVKEGGRLPDNGIGCSNRTNENKGTATVSGVHDHRVDDRGKDCLLSEAEPFSCSGEKVTEALSCSIGDAVVNEKGKTKEVEEWKNEGPLCTSSSVGNPNLNCSQAAKAYSQANINKDKVRAALEKRKRSQSDAVQKTDLMNEDDLIERELEIGIELALENKKIRKEGRQETGNPGLEPWQVAIGGVDQGVKRDLENVEEGELSSLESENSSPRWLDCMGRDRKRHQHESYG